MAFTTAAFIRKNNPELREKLKGMGYIDKTIKGNPILYANPIGAFYSTDVHYPSFRLMHKENVFDCKENEVLFIAITAIQDTSDYMQWFTNGISWYLCESVRFKNSSLFDKEYSTQIKDGSDYHKATISELLEHFK